MSAYFSTIRGLLIAADDVAADAPTDPEIKAVINAGVFRPAENERFGYWYARYLTVR